MSLSAVSQTAIMTLVCRAVETAKKAPVLNDPMAGLCLERLLSISSPEQRGRIHKWEKMVGGLQQRDGRARALTARRFDELASRYISAHSGCTVISLGAGLDTRFWRIQAETCRYIELDLPEMIELKRELLKDHLNYELLGCSVLEAAWIDQVTARGNSHFLLLAEGLLMYLPKPKATELLQRIAHRFDRSQLILDLAPEKYTKGLWQRLLQLEAHAWGLDVGIVFGVNQPRDIESFGSGFKVIGAVKGSIGLIISVSINGG